MGKEGKISSSGVTIFGMDLSTCPVAHPICSIEPPQGAHCTVCGKDLPLITSPRPRAVREPTALGTSFFYGNSGSELASTHESQRLRGSGWGGVAAMVANSWNCICIPVVIEANVQLLEIVLSCGFSSITGNPRNHVVAKGKHARPGSLSVRHNMAGGRSFPSAPSIARAFTGS